MGPVQQMQDNTGESSGYPRWTPELVYTQIVNNPDCFPPKKFKEEIAEAKVKAEQWRREQNGHVRERRNTTGRGARPIFTTAAAIERSQMLADAINENTKEDNIVNRCAQN